MVRPRPQGAWREKRRERRIGEAGDRPAPAWPRGPDCSARRADQYFWLALLVGASGWAWGQAIACSPACWKPTGSSKNHCPARGRRHSGRFAAAGRFDGCQAPCCRRRALAPSQRNAPPHRGHPLYWRQPLVLFVMPDEPFLVYHNPRCGTCRKLLALLESRGLSPRLVRYMDREPLSAEAIDRSGKLARPGATRAAARQGPGLSGAWLGRCRPQRCGAVRGDGRFARPDAATDPRRRRPGGGGQAAGTGLVDPLIRLAHGQH